MNAPDRQLRVVPERDSDPVVAIETAIAATQQAIAESPEGPVRRMLFDAAIYLDVARHTVRSERS